MTTESTARGASIHPETRMGMLSLTVADLDRSLDFYTSSIGFERLEREDGEATLGAGGKPLLHLVERQGATGWPRGGRGYTGLYHFAVLLPTRADLGAWVKHWLSLGHPIGQGDHLVSEALYLEDPDGHGIEIYRDRPREQWTWEDGRVQMGAGPVDIQGMVEEADSAGVVFSGLPSGTRLGHMHLQVGDIPEAARFYSEVVGFDIVAEMPTALFVSAGGYHHHLAVNTWHSLGADQPPDGSVKLNYFTIQLPTEEALEEVVERLRQAGAEFRQEDERLVLDDPWGNTAIFHVDKGD